MSDDDNEICPLCCEELDLSDKSFYPCKCGYQVCMWCWHRIKESESGLCPACRTPYGDDPHEFSAVDMEEVVKANKEKVAAEKRERERLRAMKEQEQREQLASYATASNNNTSSGGGGTTNFAGALAGGGGSGGLGNGGSSFGGFDGADLVAALGSAGGGGPPVSLSSSVGPVPSSSHRSPPEPPKDRSTLATMRVIRRNLVYAVGMPPSIATEEILRRPEYFGQYGKISKIVINRNHNPGADSRRTSASAYVTFTHKEDTLSCILALDGFYHDGRNIRASYGTSKYCSAFIKNVRCNNPDCTYLHHMGNAEDTFSKQEIQAGYVTSGRDVLARQQQIMAQQAAVVFGAGGGHNRRKVGGGGPSGTGKASTSPVFPPPSFDEPLPKKGRSQSAILHSRGVNSAHNAMLGGPGPGAPSAASIVAGIGTVPVVAPAPHTQLTPLTPLKRAGSMPLSSKIAAAPSSGGGPRLISAQQQQPPTLMGSSSDLTPAESLKLQQQRREAALAAQQHLQRETAMKHRKHPPSIPGSPSHSSVGSSGSRGSRKQFYLAQQNGTTAKQPPSGFISGSTPIGAISGSNLHMGSPLIQNSILGGASIGEPPASSSLDQAHTGSGILGGQLLPLSNGEGIIGGASLAPSGNPFGFGLLSSGAGGQDLFRGGSAMWGGGAEPASRPAPIGPSNKAPCNNLAPGGDVGGMSLFGASAGSFGNSGSSALASMLGIELPTGSGSLRELGGRSMQAPVGAVGAVGGLGAVNGPVGAIGTNKPNGALQPISAPGASLVGGGYTSGNSDMALLQSLLPGVNITSGNAYCAAAPQYGSGQQPVGVASLNQGSPQWNGKNNRNSASGPQQQQEQHRGTNIW